MSVENIVINIMLAMSLIGLLFIGVIFNTKLPTIFKVIEDSTDRAFAIAAFVSCDILLLCALILVANGIIEEL